MEILTNTPGLPALLLKGSTGLDALSPEERIRFSSFCLMAHRRIESVVVQKSLGALDPDLAGGFERSILLVYGSRGVREWWSMSKPAFSERFVTWMDSRLKEIDEDIGTGSMPNLGISSDEQ